MSIQRNATSTARSCLVLQSHSAESSAPLAATGQVELPARLPSQRPIDRRWDCSRGLVFSNIRRNPQLNITRKQGNSIVSGNLPSSWRSYASRPPPGRRPTVARELNQFMESSEDSLAGIGDRNAIAKTIAERKHALEERDMARKEEQQIKERLAQLQTDTKRILDKAAKDIDLLKSRNATLDGERTEAARDRDLARRHGKEARIELDLAKAEVAQLEAQNAALSIEFAEREKEHQIEHHAAMNNVLQQKLALDTVQQTILGQERDLKSRQEQFETETRSLIQRTTEDMEAFRSKLRNEYEEEDFVKNVRAQQKIIEEAQSAQSRVEREEMRTREQRLREQLAEIKEKHANELFQKLGELGNYSAKMQSSATQALKQRRTVRAAERSDYEDYSSLFTALINVDILAASWGVQAELSSKLRYWSRYPQYLVTMKDRNPWFAIKYPHLVNRLQDYGHVRRIQIQSDIAAAQLIGVQLEMARKAFEFSAHNSRESTRYFRLTPVRNNFDTTMLHNSVAALQHIRDEARRRAIALRRLESNSAEDTQSRNRMNMEYRSRQNLRKVYGYAVDMAKAQAIKAMQEDTYSKKVAFRMLHEHKEKFHLALSRMPSRGMSLGAEYDDLKRNISEIGDAISQIEKDVQKRAMLQQRLKPEIALEEEQNFREWSSKLHDQYIERARNEFETSTGRESSVPRAIRLPLSYRQRSGTRATWEKHTTTSYSARSPRMAADRVKANSEQIRAHKRSDESLVRKVEVLNMEKALLEKTLASSSGRLAMIIKRKIKQMTGKLKEVQDEFEKRKDGTAATNGAVTGESSGYKSLNLKPSAAMQARHTLGLSHTPISYNNRMGRAIDTTFVASHSTSRSKFPHFYLNECSSSACDAGRRAPHLQPFPHQINMESSQSSLTSDTSSIYLPEDDDSEEAVAPDLRDAANDIRTSKSFSSSLHSDPSARSSSIDEYDAEGPLDKLQIEDDTTSDIALTYEISAQDYRNAAKASPNSNAAFWTFRLYKNADGARPTLHYCTKFDQAEEQARKFISEPVLGFDLEWEVGSSVNSSIKDSVSLIQIASEDKIGLFQLAMFKGETIEELMPPTLRSILESERIIKAGVNIAGDATRMARHLNVKMRATMELSHLFKVVLLSEQHPHRVNRAPVSLAEQVEKVLHLPLKKDKVRTSAWSKRLNTAQTEYAGADAYAGLRLFYALEHKRKVMSPKPPRPAFHELQKPLILGDGTIIPFVKKTVEKRKKPKHPQESEYSDDEFLDALESLDSDSADEGAVVASAPFTAVDAAYPTLPSPNTDLGKLRITDSMLSPPSDELLDGVSTSQFVDENEEVYSWKPAQQQRTIDTAKALDHSATFSHAKPRHTTRSSPLDTPELALATTWTSTRLSSLRDDRTTKTGPSTLRVYHLWHVQNLDIPRVAALARDPPLMENTVASYIMTALTQERLPYDKQRARAVLQYLPRATAGRYERFFSR
nr:werner syndrome atp-dependent helicase [Quercus suber]